MKLILSFLKKYHIVIYIAYSLTLVELVTELLFPFILGIMINDGVMTQDTTSIIKWGSIMIALTILSFICGIINSYLSGHISVGVAYDIREKLFKKIQYFTLEQLQKYPTASIVTRFTNDIRQIQNMIFMGLRVMVRAPLMVIGSVIMAFVVNPKISFIFLITVPILLILIYIILRIGQSLFLNVQKHVDKVNLIIQENIVGMRIIKAFVQNNYEKNRFDYANTNLANKTKKAFRFMESSMPILMLFMNISLIIILYVGSMQIEAGTTLVGDVVAIVNYALRTVMAISMFTFLILAFARAISSSDRIKPMLEEETTQHIERQKYDQIKEGALTFQHVSFQYPNSNVKVLDDLTFSVQANETIAILGATGSGKTTLFQLIPNLYTPTKGDVYIDGIPIDNYHLQSLRQNIGYVPQTPLLFTGTIKDNILFGLKDISATKLNKVAKDAQIYDTIQTFSNGFDTIVGQKGVNLSGGQKQRLSIARALLLNPKILMLDDATSALDSKTEQQLLQAIQTYDCTTMIITQKISTAKQVDKVLILDNGKVVAYDTHEQLLKNSSFYQSIVESQVEKESSNGKI